MIVNAEGTLALSSLRWIDRGTLWSYVLGAPEPKQYRLSNARWLALVQGTADYFALVHHFEDGRVQLTAHSYGNISEIIAAIELQIEDVKSIDVKIPIPRFVGESSAWSFLPKAHVIRPFGESFLLLIDWRQKATEIQSLSWHKEAYNTMYQEILNVTEIPGSSFLIFPIQRDSEPVLYDPSTRAIVKKLKLGGESGAPQLFFRRNAAELWASDYDTLVRIDSRNWNVISRMKLQEGTGGMVRSNIGQFYLGPEEGLCLFARPYSGDVVGVDPSAFTVTLQVETEGQPQDVGLLSSGLAVARDLKTGRLLQGILQRRVELP